MAELPGHGKQAPKRHKPSRLRHEIRPDSTDDESFSQKSVIQVPRSDTMVPETQLEYHGRCESFSQRVESKAEVGDVPLSPNAAATIERCKVKKPVQSDPFKVTFLSKDSLAIGVREAPSSPPIFSFASVRKTTSKAPSNEEIAIPQSSIVALTGPALVQGKNAISKDDETVVVTMEPSVPRAADLYQHVAPDVSSMQDRDGLPSPSCVSDKTFGEQGLGFPGPTQPDTAFNCPPSAQPGSTSVAGPRKIRRMKKTRTGRKSLSSQHHGEPWPPRSSTTNVTAGQLRLAKDAALESFANPRDLSPTDHEDNHVHASEQGKPAAPMTVRNPQEFASVSQKADVEGTQSDTERPRAPQEIPGTMSQHSLLSSAQRVYPTSPEQTPLVVAEQPSDVDPEQQFIQPDGQCPIISDDHVFLDSIASHQGTNFAVPPHMYDVGHGGPPSNQHSQLENGTNTAQLPPQRQEAEAILHDTSERGGPHRVSKPRRRVRPATGTLAHSVQAPIMALSVDRSMENLRLAMLAENFRMQHEHDMATKRLTDSTATLYNMISLQATNIEEWKQRHDDLKGAFTELTVKAKTNQKYVTGLQNDHERLHKSVKSFQDQNKKILQTKVAEIEVEKSILQREVETTIEVLSNSNKKVRKVAEDLYARLELSELKGKDLAERLRKQEVMYEMERSKRDDLEQQLLSSMQNMHRQLSDSSSTLIGKLELLRSSVDKVATDDEQDDNVKECLNILRSLATTPFLATQHVLKAEGMLRFVHERMGAGFDAVLKTIKGKLSPDVELQTLIQNQLQDLRTKLTIYNHVVAEDCTARLLNEDLKKHLEDQRSYSAQLDEQVKTSQGNEADLKARCNQLEPDLTAVRAMVHEPVSEPSEHEMEILELRQQLKKGEEDLEATRVRAEIAEQARYELAQESAKYKKWYEGAKAGWIKFNADMRREKTEDNAEMREKITKEFNMKFNDQERHFVNEIHRLPSERKESEQARHDLRNEMNATKDQLAQLGQTVVELESNLHDVREEKRSTEARLETALQENHSSMTEVSDLKKRLLHSAEELRSKTQNHAELERELTDASSTAAGLQNLHDELQVRVSQQTSTIADMRQQTDSRLFEVQQDAQKAIKLTLDQVSTLEQEKQSLTSKLEQAQSNEAGLSSAQASLSAERKSLQQRLIELSTVKEVAEADILRLQYDFTNKERNSTERHRTEVEDWSLRLVQTSAALKEAEAKLRLSEDQSNAKIAFDRKFAEARLQELEKKYQQALQSAKGQQLPQIMAPAASSSGPLQNALGSKNRKKVSRQNQSILNMNQVSGGQVDELPSTGPFSQSGNQKTGSAISERYPTLFEENARADDFLDEPSLPLLDHVAEFVPDTQDFGNLAMSQEIFNERLTQASRHETNRQIASSTDLSSVESEDLRQMQSEIQSLATPMLRGHHHSSSKNWLSGKSADEVSDIPDNASVAGSRSSHSRDRPRSQANTASRMMPPPGNTSHRSGQDTGTKGLDTHKMKGKQLDSSGTSTPDFMHPSPSTPKHTYSQHEPQPPSRKEAQHGIPRAIVSGHTEKRKSPNSQTEKGTATKKQRILSHSSSVVPSSSSRIQQPFQSTSSAVGSRSKTHTRPSYDQEASATTSRSKIQASSSSVQSRTSSQMSSSDEAYGSRRRQPSSSQIHVVTPTRRTSSRIARSNAGRNGSAFEDRFDRELDGRH